MFRLLTVFVVLVVCGSGSYASHSWGIETVPWGRQKRHTKKLGGCIDYKFQCSNGACLQNVTNILESLVCPPVVYRCAYGISGKFECKGRSNCADRFDIFAPKCPKLEETYSRAGNCGKDKFQCKNKQCVHEDEVCNGKADCSDGSDETTQICINNYCPSYAFRCAYGGCVPRKSRCNRVIDCIDSSDETVALCGRWSAPITRSPDKNRLPGSCAVPAFENGRVISPITNEIYGPEHFAQNGERLLFACLDTTLVGDKETYCFNGQLMSEPPKCQKGCSTLLLDTLSVQATCTDMHLKPINCTEIVPPFTVAHLVCKTGYERPQDEDRNFEDAITCREDGQWSQHIGRCEPVCGEVGNIENRIFGGVNARISEVPWHVGVYELQNGNYGQTCGGSIISQTAILSAAHCFWNETADKVKDVNSLAIVAGKTIRDYYAEEIGMQIFEIIDVHVASGYRGFDNLFVGDIAVVRLKTPIIYQTFIRPICILDPNMDMAAKNIGHGTTGKVAGWGVNQNNVFSPVLKVVNLMAIDYQTCIENNHNSFTPYVTPDKFCASVLNESVCQGDSGGGFAEAVTGADGVIKYYLRGLVSVAPRVSVGKNETQGESCHANKKHSAFTKVLSYENLFYEFTQT